MDSIHVVKRIFNPFTHPFQKHSVSILKDLQLFFSQYQENYIEFWKCPSQYNWHSYKVINTETKSFKLILILLCKLSWDFSKKSECNDLIKKSKITFQASDMKGKQFPDLIDGNDNLLEPLYIKGGLWFQNFGYSNSLCTRVSRAITNHVPTDEYRLRFFPNEEFRCLCN